MAMLPSKKRVCYYYDSEYHGNRVRKNIYTSDPPLHSLSLVLSFLFSALARCRSAPHAYVPPIISTTRRDYFDTIPRNSHTSITGWYNFREVKLRDSHSLYRATIVSAILAVSHCAVHSRIFRLKSLTFLPRLIISRFIYASNYNWWWRLDFHPAIDFIKQFYYAIIHRLRSILQAIYIYKCLNCQIKW